MEEKRILCIGVYCISVPVGDRNNILSNELKTSRMEAFMKAEVESSDAPEDSMQPVGNSKDQSIADKNKATIAPSTK